MDEAHFVDLTQCMVGLPIAATWLGDYTALYLEIGPLTGVYSKSGRPKAQLTAYLGFQWVLESDAGQELSSADPAAAKRIGSTLTGDHIAAVSLSPFYELILTLQSRRLVYSVAADTGESEWTLYLPTGSCIAVEARRLVLESSDD